MFKFIFIVVVIFYGFRLLAKLLFPMFIKKMVNNVAQKAREQHGYTAQKSTEEGETVIDKTPIKQNQAKNKIGEYVDFEEVD